MFVCLVDLLNIEEIVAVERGQPFGEAVGGLEVEPGSILYRISCGELREQFETTSANLGVETPRSCPFHPGGAICVAAYPQVECIERSYGYVERDAPANCLVLVVVLFSRERGFTVADVGVVGQPEASPKFASMRHHARKTLWEDFADQQRTPGREGQVGPMRDIPIARCEDEAPAQC